MTSTDTILEGHGGYIPVVKEGWGGGNMETDPGYLLPVKGEMTP